MEIKYELPNMDKATEAFKNMKPQLVKSIGDKLLKAVQANVDSSGINDAHGHVKSWQELRIGSAHGYAAVSPAKSKSGSDSPGAITNYLESGHKTRMPSGRAQRYTPRIEKTRTTAYGFYRSAKSQADQIARDAALEIEQKLSGVL